MKKLAAALALALAFLTVPNIVFAQAAPAKQEAITPGSQAGLTLRDCISVLRGLQLLDGRRVIVGAGKSTESAETVPYKFAGKVRSAISHNLFVLGQVQLEVDSADRRLRAEIGKEIKPGSKEEEALVGKINEYAERPCKVELDKISDSDLRLDDNEIPGTVLAAIWKIRER